MDESDSNTMFCCIKKKGRKWGWKQTRPTLFNWARSDNEREKNTYYYSNSNKTNDDSDSGMMLCCKRKGSKENENRPGRLFLTKQRVSKREREREREKILLLKQKQNQWGVTWNQLPVSVRHSTAVSSFESSLKTFLFLKTFSSVSLPGYATGVCVCVCVCVRVRVSVCARACVRAFMLYALKFDNVHL